MATGNMALVVDQAGAALEAGTHDTIALVHADGRRERVGVKALGSVVLHGDVKLSTSLLQLLARHGVALTILPLRGRASTAGFTSMPHRHVLLRHEQHLAYADPARRLELAVQVVLAKLEAMAEFARAHEPENTAVFYQAMQTLRKSPDIAGLMGVEGAATLKHFANLATSYERDGSFRFNGRSRPPQDEPNALMSLAYTMAQAQATQLTLHCGLDAQLGFLHALHRDRESLALDLIEPVRALLDDWVHDLLVRRRLVTAPMFSQASGEPMRLTKEGRATFYPLWFHEGYNVALRPMRRMLAVLIARLRRGR